MSRVLKRPMFKMGGPADGGITSGLSRRGYHEGGIDRPIRTRTTPEEILQGYGPAPRGYNVYDFLTEWGLNMVGNPPSGNVIQTAGKEAQIPFGKMMEGKGKAGQLEYAMRAQAHDAARAEGLAHTKMDLQEYLEDEKRKSAEKIAGMKGDEPPVDYYTRYNTNFDNLRNVRDGVLPYETYRDGMAHWKTLKEFNTDIILGPVIEQTLEDGTTTQWKMKEDQDTLKKYVGERVWDPTAGDAGAYKIVIEEDGIYKWSEPYYSNVGSGKDKYEDITLIKIDDILKNKSENKDLINGDETIELDITEKIENVDTRGAVTKVLKILNDASRQELETLATERGHVLIPEKPAGNKQKLYYQIQRKDLGGTFRGSPITTMELIDIIKKEAFEKQYGNIKKKQR